jgi:hypothetical protein
MQLGEIYALRRSLFKLVQMYKGAGCFITTSKTKFPTEGVKVIAKYVVLHTRLGKVRVNNTHMTDISSRHCRYNCRCNCCISLEYSCPRD